MATLSFGKGNQKEDYLMQENKQMKLPQFLSCIYRQVNTRKSATATKPTIVSANLLGADSVIWSKNFLLILCILVLWRLTCTEMSQ